MRTNRDQRPLSYPLRLPDELQADALRLLDLSREVVNAVVTSLWDRLDDFGERTNKYAYKQVEEMTSSPQLHGDRQWRCEAEQAGRILRGQAERKKQFALILPILSQGMIQPKTETKRAGKNRKAIKEVLGDLREENTDGGSAVELQSLIEQACNYYLTHGCFPDHYEDMQAVPIQQTAVLPYAGDDGRAMGQSYRMSLDLEHKMITLAIRTPSESGKWARNWREKTIKMVLPELVLSRVKQGQVLAPSLREIKQPDGVRYAVLDFIVEVPIPEAARWPSMRYVLGFDWGCARSSQPAWSIWRAIELGVPSFWTQGRLMDDKPAPGGRSTSSRRKWPKCKPAVTISPRVIPGRSQPRENLQCCAGRLPGAGESTRPGIKTSPISLRMCYSCSPRLLAVN